MLIIGSARHGKTNTLLNLIKQQNEDDYNIIDKIYMLRIQLKQNINILLKTWEKIGLKELEDPKALIEYSNNMQDVYKNIEEYYPNRKQSITSLWWYDCWYDY